MDDSEDDARYLANSYGLSQQGYGSSSHQKLPARNAPYHMHVGNEYVHDEEEDEVEEDEDEEDLVEEDAENNQSNGIRYVGKDDDGDDEDGDEDEDVGEEVNEDGACNNYNVNVDEDDFERHPKKRKLKSLLLSYEFAPRVPVPPAVTPVTKPSSAGRNPLTDWTEHETLVLLEAWGDKFLQHGRKSLRSEEWHEVAEKVSEVSKIERTDTQCRNRLDTLKKKYKKEKSKLEEAGGGISKWVYFKKMDMLMSTSAQQGGLSCGLDSGEYVFMNSRAHLNRANGYSEMRDSPGNLVSDEEDDSDGLPPKKRRSGRDRKESSSFRLLADSIQKFSHIYQKIETSRSQQMLELEKMRMDFLRDLEMQRRQIMERTFEEIAKIQHGDRQ